MQEQLSGQPLQVRYRGTSVHLHRRRSLVMKQAQRHKMLCEQVPCACSTIPWFLEQLEVLA